jgi:hypothetical protein
MFARRNVACWQASEGSEREQKFFDRGLRLIVPVSLMMVFGYALAQPEAYPPRGSFIRR